MQERLFRANNLLEGGHDVSSHHRRGPFTTILPAMTLIEALETTRIHRVAGLTVGRTAVVTTRPCRAPTTSPSQT